MPEPAFLMAYSNTLDLYQMSYVSVLRGIFIIFFIGPLLKSVIGNLLAQPLFYLILLTSSFPSYFNAFSLYTTGSLLGKH